MHWSHFYDIKSEGVMFVVYDKNNIEVAYFLSQEEAETIIQQHIDKDMLSIENILLKF